MSQIMSGSHQHQIHSQKRMMIHVMVLLSGMAALSWEVIWQIKSTLALGVSAWGTALTLAVTMGGMSVGSLLMGHALRARTVARPLRIYGVLEIIVGLCGLMLGTAFQLVEAFDTKIYAGAASQATLVHILGIAAVLGLPTMCLGATLPVLGLTARQFGVSIASLYGLNTLGAAAGVMLAAFVFIPAFGLAHAILFISAINIIVGCAAWVMGGVQGDAAPVQQAANSQNGGIPDYGWLLFLIVFITGFATFVLEISWFRSMTAAFFSSTDAFAIMLAAVLLSLGLGAAAVPLLKKNQKISIGLILGWAGICILLATPFVERFDMRSVLSAQFPLVLYMQWFGMTFYAVGAPMTLLGIALPWILDSQTNPRRWGLLYGFNAFAAIAGSIGAAWFFLPALGFARTAWLMGVLVTGTAMLILPRQKKKVIGLAMLAALAVAIIFESGVGRTRVQGTGRLGEERKLEKILQFYEGPDSTVSAVEYITGRRALFIDGFSATEQAGPDSKILGEHYMQWMGHLPMLLHPDPKKALVICFGTGQTANAVRNENPEFLRIVDINKNVFKLAGYFDKNEGVLEDPRVHTTVMDGRAWMRRTDEKYDVITMEPMPPTFAGVNALYSREFYQHAREHMTSQGMIAQWLPIHLVAPDYSESVARTFQSVFPNAILWVDPPTKTGILIGSADDSLDLSHDWPGFARTQIERNLTQEQVEKAVVLDREKLARYAKDAVIISDDNQLLAYGRATHMMRTGRTKDRETKNMERINAAAAP